MDATRQLQIGGHVLVLSLLFVICLLPVCQSKHSQKLDVMVDNMTLCTAVLDYNYRHPHTGSLISKSGILARYGASSKCVSEQGLMVHMEDRQGTNHGCEPHNSVIPHRQWIALVKRGHCKFDQKIYQAAIANNASAVVVYNNKDEGDLPLMYHMGQYTGVILC